MPEVKWVHPTNLYGFNPNSVGRVTGHVPVLTLDELEAWLKQHGKCDCPHADINSSQEYDRHHAWWCSVSRTNSLLAQVQAMKEGRT